MRSRGSWPQPSVQEGCLGKLEMSIYCSVNVRWTKFPENLIRDKRKELPHILAGPWGLNNDDEVYYQVLSQNLEIKQSR